MHQCARYGQAKSAGWMCSHADAGAVIRLGCAFALVSIKDNDILLADIRQRH